MSTFYLVLAWAVLGLIVGALALAAHLKPATWNKYGWLWLLALSLGSSLLGGIGGFWLLGRLFSLTTALWIAILATCVPGLYGSLRRRFIC